MIDHVRFDFEFFLPDRASKYWQIEPRKLPKLSAFTKSLHFKVHWERDRFLPLLGVSCTVCNHQTAKIFAVWWLHTVHETPSNGKNGLVLSVTYTPCVHASSALLGNGLSKCLTFQSIVVGAYFERQERQGSFRAWAASKGMFTDNYSYWQLTTDSAWAASKGMCTDISPHWQRTIDTWTVRRTDQTTKLRNHESVLKKHFDKKC